MKNRKAAKLIITVLTLIFMLTAVSFAFSAGAVAEYEIECGETLEFNYETVQGNVYVKFVPEKRGVYTVSEDSDYPCVSLYDGSKSFLLLAPDNNDNGYMNVCLDEGVTYYISVNLSEENCDVSLKVREAQTDIEYIEAEDYSVDEMAQGFFDTGYSAEEGKDIEYYTYETYSIDPSYVKIYYKDGTEIDSDSEDYFGYDNIYSCQNADCIWTAGNTYPAGFEYSDVISLYNVTVTESDVESIEAQDISIMENTNGFVDIYWEDIYDEDGYWSDSVEHSWFHYTPTPGNITINYKDGTSATYGDEDFEESGYLWECRAIQSYDKQWATGDNKAVLTVGNKKTEFTVTLTENTIEGIVPDDVEITEYTHGYISEDENFNEWYRYSDIIPESYTVSFKDGSSDTYSKKELSELIGCSLEYETDQSYENQWDIGEHKATVEFGIYKCDYTVKIIETNIKSISIGDISVVQGTHGWYNEIYDDEGNPTGEYWYKYDICPEEFTIEYTDGTTGKFESAEDLCNALDLDSYDYGYVYEQNQNNPWTVGSNKVTFKAGSYSCDFNVVIESNGISSVVIEDMSVREGTNGYYEYDEGNSFFRYDVDPEKVKVNYTDGTSAVVEIYNLSDLNIDYRLNDSQNSDNVWDIGKHKVTMFYGGSGKVQYNIEILPTDIESISADKVTLIENISGYEYDEYDDELGEITWFCYSVEPENIKITYKDKTEKVCPYYDFYDLTGYDISVTDDQAYNNQWGVGTHKATLKAYNFTCEFEAEVVEYEYTDFIFEPITVTEGKDGYLSEIDGDDAETPYYFHYYVEPLKFTAVKKDGTRTEYDYFQFEEISGFYLNWESEQSAETPWGVGEHTASAQWLGKTFELKVTVEENGVSDVKLDKVQIQEGVNGYYTIDNKDGEKSHRFIFSVQPQNITLTIGGETVNTTGIDLWDDTGFDFITFIPGQNEEQLSKGVHTAKIYIGSDVYDFEVEVVDGPIESISVEKVVLYEKLDSESEFEWDDDDNEYEWQRYKYYPGKVTVKLKDEAESTEYDYSDMGMLPFVFEYYDNQSYNNEWKTGENKAIFVAGGASCEFTVEVKEFSENLISATEISPNNAYTAEVTPYNKVYYKFTPDLTDRYSFFSMTDEDTHAWLYDKDFNQISYSDDDQTSYNFNITEKLKAGETYYFAVAYLADAGEGSFDVRLSGSVCQHEFSDFVSDDNATCTADGTKTAKCKYCIKVKIETEEGTKKPHDMTEWTVTDEATCTEEGTRIRNCKNCSFIETEAAPASGHKESEAVKENENKPTCTKNGTYEAVVYCSICGVEISRKTVSTDLLAHKEEIIPAVASTCSSSGYTEGKKCSVCGTVTVAPVETAKLPHKWIPATCTTEKICSDCKLKEGTVSEHKEEIVPAVAPTCTEKGYTEGKKCSLCGKVLVAQKEITPVGHSEALVSGKAATCFEKGYTVGRVCSVCDEIIEERKEIPVLSHMDEDGDYKCDYGCGYEFTKPSEPTTQPSTKPSEEPTKPSEEPTKPSEEPTTKPSVEDTTKPSEEPTTKPSVEDTTKPSEESTTQHQHTEIIIPAVPATYEKGGLTEGKKCSVCGEILVAQKATARKKLKKVTKLKVKKTSSTYIKLSWSKVTGADSYKVYYSTNGKKWKSVKVKKNTATIKKLKSGTQYRFKVRAFAGKYYGTASKVVKKTTKVKKPTLSSVKSLKKSQATVNWKKVTNANGYVVEYSTSKKFTKKTTKTVKIKKGKTVKTTLKKLKSGKKYYVRVKAYKTVNKKSVYGAYSKVKTVKVK